MTLAIGCSRFIPPYLRNDLEPFLRKQARSRADIDEIWAAFKREPVNQELRNALIKCNLPLVRYNADRVWSVLRDETDLSVLISSGVFSLFDAINGFNIEQYGVKCETYCMPRLRNAMLAQLLSEAKSSCRTQPIVGWWLDG